MGEYAKGYACAVRKPKEMSQAMDDLERGLKRIGAEDFKQKFFGGERGNRELLDKIGFTVAVLRFKYKKNDWALQIRFFDMNPEQEGVKDGRILWGKLNVPHVKGKEELSHKVLTDFREL